MDGEANRDDCDAWDVVICGGGLAGLTLARQLRREIPQARVVVVERQRRPLPDAAHKVGESSVELSSHYFGEVLGLGGYLRERHLVKNGLRFFPGGGSTHTLAQRTEIGPPDMPKVPSFQLDRGRLENDLRAFAAVDGITVLEGWSVREIELGGADDLQPAHRVTISEGAHGASRTLRARWVVDAAGRAALLRKKLDLTRPSGHVANASWFRVEGRLDVRDLVPAEDREWHGRDPDHVRWLSTVHFMGTGYWLWLIPLSTGYTSVGVVVHDSEHSYDSIRTLERVRAWITTHEPEVAAMLDASEQRGAKIEDFLCLRHYSHSSAQCFSASRWALVGEAGVFADPFYSPGSDFIALSNSFTTELIRADLAGESIADRAPEYDAFYLRFFDVTCETYRHSAPVYGSPTVLAAKVYWDNFGYWSLACQYFFKRIYALSPEQHGRFIEIAQGYAALNFRAQKLLSEWAKRLTNVPIRRHVMVPPIPSILANLHLDLVKPMTVVETETYLREKLAQLHEVLCEIVLRVVVSLDPVRVREVADAVQWSEWGLSIPEARLVADAAEGGSRRRGLPAIARDMERCLGRMERHPAAVSLRDAVAYALASGPSIPEVVEEAAE